MNNSKICLVVARNLSHITQLNKYLDLTDGNLDIIYWNRENIKEESSARNAFAYNCPIRSDDSKRHKIIAYMGFRRFSINLLRTNQYKKIIVLPTQAVLAIYDYLVFSNAGNYLLVIKDYTAENKRIFQPIMRNLIAKAGLVSLSSPAFQSFLPIRDYVIDHNYVLYNKNEISEYRNAKMSAYSNPIVISSVGGIRFIDECKKTIQTFANDSRYILRFDGVGSERLASTCKALNANNVILTGSFERKETFRLNSLADIANGAYGNNNPSVDYLLSNRLYNAAQIGMPILVSPGTYMEKVTSKYGIGFVLDYANKNLKDDLYNWYVNLDKKELFASCDNFMRDAYEDDKIYRQVVSNWLRS